jgi:hypothetical protein
VSHASSDRSAFRRNTDELFFACVDHLLAAVGDVTEIEKRFGISKSRDTIIFNLPMREYFKPISATIYDWVHNWLVSGIAQFEIGHLFVRAHAIGALDLKKMGDFAAAWSWPSAFRLSSGRAREILTNKKRIAACLGDGKFRASASETLNILPVLTFYVTKRLAKEAELAEEVYSYMCMARTLNGLKYAQQFGRYPAGFGELVERHLRAVAVAYGLDSLIPKHHMGPIHVEEEIEQTGILLGTFLHEA